MPQLGEAWEHRRLRHSFLEKTPITLLCPNTMAKFETPESPRINEEMLKLIDQKVVVNLLTKMFLAPKSERRWRPVFNLKRLDKYVSWDCVTKKSLMP
nr:unnamed protein product [Callosobruchus analis]